MNDLIKMLFVSSAALCLGLTVPGCGESSSSDASGTSGTHAAGDGHDHGEEGDDGHDHASAEHDDHEGHEDHGEARSLGSVEIAGTMLTVSISGAVNSGDEVHIDLEHTGGPSPTTVRLWIGDESGTGALKTKADGHDDHFHGHTEVPASLDGASLWIEIEAADGSRTAASVPLE